ncbi:MAG: hypothetical protein AB1393_14385 [Candidatus Edwardsbacteria bacterium]
MGSFNPLRSLFQNCQSVQFQLMLTDKEFYKKYRFLSFKDRYEKLKEFTDYLNYIKPNMAIGGLTPYEKLMKIKSEKGLTENPNCGIVLKTMQQEEVMNKKLAA